MTMERSRFSAAMMRSVEVGIYRSAGGHTRAHLDPTCAGAASAAAAEAEAEARLISSAAILVVVATAARRIRRGHTSRESSLPPHGSSAAALEVRNGVLEASRLLG